MAFFLSVSKFALVIDIWFCMFLSYLLNSENLFDSSYISDGPSAVVIFPSNSTTDLEEGQNFGPISCSADCNPSCSIQWRLNATMGNSIFVNKTTQNGVLHIVNVRRSMACVYRCIARNIVGYYRTDVSLKVLCKYPIYVWFQLYF